MSLASFGTMPPSGQTLQVAFEQESRALCRHAVQVTASLAVPLIVVFGVLESSGLLSAPDFFPALRLGCATSLVSVLWLSRGRTGHAHPHGLFGGLIGAVGLMLIVMTLATGRDESPYFVGIALLLLCTAAFMPWPTPWSAGSSIVLVAAYAGAMLLTGPIASRRMFASNVSLLLATGAIVTVSTAFRERLRWREFVNRVALTDALQARREFMAKMSHELRTPLHVIVGYSDILLEEFLPAEQVDARALVDRSRTCAVSLHRMISDLLDYAKVEAGKMDVHQESVRVTDLVQDVVAGFRPITERKGLRLAVDCDDALPDVLSDRQRIQQILINLVGNAVKFTETGTVSVEVRLVCEALDGFRVLTPDGVGARALPEAEIAIFVRDTGMGIAESDLERLAQDFQQVADAAAGHYGGTGLGLSISKKLAQLLGGRIAVRSRATEGSTFALLLPAPAPRHRAAA